MKFLNDKNRIFYAYQTMQLKLTATLNEKQKQLYEKSNSCRDYIKST